MRKEKCRAKGYVYGIFPSMISSRREDVELLKIPVLGMKNTELLFTSIAWTVSFFQDILGLDKKKRRFPVFMSKKNAKKLRDAF